MMKLPAATLCFCLLTLLETTVYLGISSPVSLRDSNDTFTIQHSSTRKCLDIKILANLSLSTCDSNRTQLWKWGSGHRLFHVDSSLCLALDVKSKTLKVVDCGSSVLLWWRCLDGVVYTVYEMGLMVSDGKVGVKRNTDDTWVRGGSQDNICHRAYQVIHTSQGNSAGAPCEFPFKYNNSWYHGCLPDASVPGLSWCATSSDYDQEQKWGNCLIPEKGCQFLFSGPDGEFCYQFVSGATVTWHEALDSCRSQGADLLSVTESDDLKSTTLLEGFDQMPERMWIGLHQLDFSQGWQWSDGSPLSVVRWEAEMPSRYFPRADCGVLNSRRNYEPESCSKRLPYICKKSVNASSSATSDPGVYKETVCVEGWVPWNGWCYKLVKNNSENFSGAQQYCNSTGGGANLASFHSIDSTEMINTHFHADSRLLNVWIGLSSVGVNSTVFKWVDQEPVTFTYWDQNQPSQPNKDNKCVFYSGQSHWWRVGSCTQKLPFMCQKKGEVNESAAQVGCRHEDGWVRHGNSCYQVNTKQVFFKDHCNMTVRNRFEQAFINSLLGKLISNKTQYFWIGLQDLKNRGQYQWMSQDGSPGVVSYTNWGFLEPDHDGGCAVISTEVPLGKWEVKNCTLFQAGTICRKDLSPPSDPHPDPESELNSTASCPDGWRSRIGVRYCYKVFHEERISRKRSWEEAWSFCQALGADLPSFTNIDEMTTLHSIVRESISDDRFFWVGLNRRNPADVSWQWSDGRPVSFDTLHHEFHEDDAYSRDCTAFKSLRNSLTHMIMYLLHDISLTPFLASPFHCEAQLEWICQIPRGKTPEHPKWYNPGGYHATSIFIDGAEFWFIKDLKLSFMEAELFCNSNDGNLASPKTSTALARIHQELHELSSSTNQKWWIGLSQPGSSLPPFARKYSHYSQFFGRCSYISYEEPFPANHQSCYEKSSFVCEKHNVTSVEKSPLEPQPGGFSCGNSSVSFRNKCYTLMSMPTVPFKLANERCQSVRGSLVTISDQVEQDFINTLLPKIGNMERIWIGLKIRKNDPEWVDQSPVSFFNFNPLLLGMHKTIRVNTYEKESMTMCAFLINNPSSGMMGTWDYASCSWYQDLGICQHYADKVEEPSVPQEPIQVNNHTFLLIVKKLTWFEALEECTNKSMDLASVSDTLLQSTLTVHVSRARTPMWIGLFSEDDGIHYRWTDHSHTVFSRWSSEPTSGRCVYLDLDGFWKATQCEEERGGAICHKPHMETITKPEDVAVKCPHAIKGPNWIPWRKNCYSFQLSPKRWDAFNKGQLSETCRHHHAEAEILTIRNQQENEFIASQLKPFTSLVQYVWLGLFRDEDNKTKWFDKTYVQYSNWTSGRPDLDAPFLAGLSTDGSWSLIKSSNFREFKQQSIVACKLDKDSKEEFQQSVKDLQKLDSITYEVMTRSVTWSEALAECSQRGGHLASVHDQKHHEHLQSIVKTDGFPLWIGLSRQDGSGSAYEWSDGTNWDYKINSTDTLMDSNLDPHKAKCVFMNPAGELKKTSCDVVQEGAICYITTTTTPSQRAKLKAAPDSNHCPESSDGASNWVQYEDHCYLFNMSFYNYSVYEMMEAKSICYKLDAHLLTINTKEENDFLTRHITDDPLITSRVWLDLKFDLRGRPVSWQDGSTLSYTNMKSESPSTGKSPETLCAIMMVTNGGGWETVSCDLTKSRVVCKTQAKSSSSHVALGFFITALIVLLLAAGFVLYKKKRAHFSSSIRYERTLDDMDTTSIITDAE